MKHSNKKLWELQYYPNQKKRSMQNSSKLSELKENKEKKLWFILVELQFFKRKFIIFLKCVSK